MLKPYYEQSGTLVAAKHYAPAGQPPRVEIRVDVTAGLHPIAVPASPLPLFERTSDGDRNRPAGWRERLAAYD
jgi:hypothetical protein